MLDILVNGVDRGIRALSEAFAGPVHSYCKLETVDEGALVADDGSLRFTRVLGQYDPLDKTKALVFEAPVRLENASPEAVRLLMSATPTIHFVSFAQGVLFRGAGIETIWPSLLAICVTGSVFFWIANVRLRKTIGEME